MAVNDFFDYIERNDEYTYNDYVEDMKLVNYVYKRYYSKYHQLTPDFKYEIKLRAVLKLYSIRKNYNPLKCSYPFWAIIRIRRTMSRYAKTYVKNLEKSKTESELLSLDNLIDGVDDKTFNDSLISTSLQCDGNYELCELQIIIDEVIKSFGGEKAKLYIKEWLRCFSVSDVMRKYNVCKSSIQRVINNFRQKLRMRLKDLYNF